MKDRLNALTEQIIGAAIAVHRELGPGMLESAYETALRFELRSRGFTVERQVALPIVYLGHKLDGGYRVDLIVSDDVLVELKCVEKLLPVHRAQVLSHLRFSKRKVALLINFNVTVLTQGGIRRIVNGFPD